MRTYIMIKSLLFFGILIVTYVDASDIQIVNPVIRYPDTLSIYIHPFGTSDNDTSIVKDWQIRLIDILTEKGTFNYIFYTPRKNESETISKYGFTEKIDKKKKYPRDEYWKNKNIQYIIFGSYDTDKSDQIKIEFYLYSIRIKGLLIGKKYIFRKDETQKLYDKIVNEIVENLKKYHRDADSVR